MNGTANGTVKLGSRLQYKTYNGRDDWREGLAKAWAAEHGYGGAQGGWIYNSRGTAVTQGWGSFYHLRKVTMLDWLTRKLTGAESFQGLLTANGTYRPTIIVRKGTSDGWMYEVLAEAYDEAQRERGDKRRAHRGRGYYRIGINRGVLTANHIVNGEHEADGKGLCGARFEHASYGDLTPNVLDRVTCRRCRELAGVA